MERELNREAAQRGRKEKSSRRDERKNSKGRRDSSLPRITFGGPSRAERRGRAGRVALRGASEREVEGRTCGEDEAIITGTAAVVKCQRGRA